MPFDIGCTGAAPITTFFRVRELKFKSPEKSMTSSLPIEGTTGRRNLKWKGRTPCRAEAKKTPRCSFPRTAGRWHRDPATRRICWSRSAFRNKNLHNGLVNSANGMLKGMELSMERRVQHEGLDDQSLWKLPMTTWATVRFSSSRNGCRWHVWLARRS